MIARTRPWAFAASGGSGGYGNRVLVLVDGQPMNDDWLGSSYVGYDARVGLEDVERIEVVRGPGSVLYGTNAFSGVINLVTRSRPSAAAKPGFRRPRASRVAACAPTCRSVPTRACGRAPRWRMAAAVTSTFRS